MYDRNLSEELRMMRQSCREFVDAVVLPFIKENWKLEWSMVPEERLPARILEEADKIGIRTLGVPEEYGGVELEKGTEVKTFAVISEEIARGELVRLLPDWELAHTPLWLVYPQQRQRPLRAKVFIEFLLRWIGGTERKAFF